VGNSLNIEKAHRMRHTYEGRETWMTRKTSIYDALINPSPVEVISA
jgi:hypothetical protein